MITIEFEITAEEADAIRVITRESAQNFLERNARIHIADCAAKVEARTLSDLGLPASLATSGLKSEEVALLKSLRSKDGNEEDHLEIVKNTISEESSKAKP